MNKPNIISNGQFVNCKNGIVRVTVIAEDTTYHNMAIFSSMLSVPNEGISLPLNTVLSNSREINNLFDAEGSFSGSTKGNEILTDRKVNISLADDFVYLTNDVKKTELSKNIIYNMMAGEGFINTVSTNSNSLSTLWKVVGTNGNIKRDKRANYNLNHKMLLNHDGKLIIPQASDWRGKKIFQNNTIINAYNDSTVCIMLEILTEFSTNKKSGYRYVYCAPSNLLWTEDSDYNKISLDINFLSDVRYIDKFFIDGISSSEKDYVFSFTGNNLNEVIVFQDGVAMIDIDKITHLKDFSEEDYNDYDNTFRIYYNTKDNHTGYFIISRFMSSKLNKKIWLPLPVSVDKEAIRNVMLNNTGEIINDIRNPDLDFEKSFCFPIYDFNFELSKFIIKDSSTDSILSSDDGYYYEGEYLPITGGTLLGDLSVNGTVAVAKEIVQLSDIKYKKDISNIEDPIEKIKKINGYTYYLNDYPEEKRIGLLAQEVEKICPELITEINGIKCVRYTDAIALLFSCLNKILNK